MPQEPYDDTMNQLLLRIRAGCPIIYLVTYEEGRVLDNIARLVRAIRRENPNKHLWTYYDSFGLMKYGLLPPHGEGPLTSGEAPGWLDIPGLADQRPAASGQAGDAISAIKRICDAEPNTEFELSDSVVVFFDLHPMLTELNPAAVRPLRNAADRLRRYYDAHRGDTTHPYKTIIVVAPTEAGLSGELERDLIKMWFPLPEKPELEKELQQMITGPDPLQFPKGITDEDRRHLCELISGAGRGLTLDDYRRGLQLFKVSGLLLNEGLIEQMHLLKARVIRSEKALEYSRHDDFKLGGLTKIKEWMGRRKDPAISDTLRERYHLAAPKGVMLCGVSGGGKSQLAKLIAKVFNLALLRLDVGALFGQYIGQSEENTRKALRLAEVLAPVVLWIDEVDKAFSGMDGAGDGGVSSRVFGQLLTWMSEKRDNVFVVATANNFKHLLQRYPEFLRRGRFDEIFWLGLPDAPTRAEIFKVYLEPHTKPDDDGNRCLNLGPAELDALCTQLGGDGVSQKMTGAEIESAVNDALYEAYDLDRGELKRDKFTPELLSRVVIAAKSRALYNGGEAATTLAELTEAATQAQWIAIQ